VITILESHYRFNIEVNKINSSFGKAFNPYEIDILLNQAQMAFLSEKLNNKQGNGVEFDNVVMNQISPILIPKESVVPTANVISALSEPVYKFISYEIDGLKDGCTKRFVECRFVRHQDILYTTQQSSWKWGICNAYIAGDNLAKSIILQPTDFTIPTAYVSYYRFPTTVTVGGYTDVNGDSLTAVEWDFTDDNTVMEIIKKAALLAMESIQPTIETKNLAGGLFK